MKTQICIRRSRALYFTLTTRFDRNAKQKKIKKIININSHGLIYFAPYMGHPQIASLSLRHVLLANGRRIFIIEKRIYIVCCVQVSRINKKCYDRIDNKFTTHFNKQRKLKTHFHRSHNFNSLGYLNATNNMRKRPLHPVDVYPPPNQN